MPAVLINNFFTFTNDTGQEVIQTRDLIQANFTNCIIDGSLFNFNVANSMVKFQDLDDSFINVPEVDFTDVNLYQNIILNGFANFRDRSSNDFIIGQNSDAIGQGNATGAAQAPMDILGVIRTVNPDLGAYQHIDF